MLSSFLRSSSLQQAVRNHVGFSRVVQGQFTNSFEQLRFEATSTQTDPSASSIIIPSIPVPERPYQLTSGVCQRPSTPNAHYAPWTPTRLLLKSKTVRSRMMFLMKVLETEKEVEYQNQRSYPDFKVGDVLDVTMVAPENERKVYLHRGLCIQKNDKGISSSFKIYCVFSDSGGFIQHIPLHMPDLLDIKIVGQVEFKDEEDLMELVTSEAKECKFLDKIVKL